MLLIQNIYRNNLIKCENHEPTQGTRGKCIKEATFIKDQLVLQGL